jgi:hypothetical protein
MLRVQWGRSWLLDSERARERERERERERLFRARNKRLALPIFEK